MREALGAEYDALGGAAFREKLRLVDPERAEKLAPGDKKRLVRAMEVYTLTGETITAHDARTKALPPRYASRRFALTWNERETLYARIRQRVDEMVAAGLFEEVERLLGAGLSDSCTAMQAIGYKEIAAALRGECSPEDAIETVKRESCRYAKRQLFTIREHTPKRVNTYHKAGDPGERELLSCKKHRICRTFSSTRPAKTDRA